MALTSPFADVETKLVAVTHAAMRVYGVRRSGNHAIINWLIRNSDADSTIFLNSCTNSRSAVKTCGASEIDRGSYGKQHRLAAAIKDKIFETNAAPFLIISYEAGLQPAHFDSGQQTLGIADAVFDKEILITRSFANWFASFAVLVGRMNQNRARLCAENSADILAEVSVFKAHLKAVRNYRNKDRFVHIGFDQWFEQPEYRQQKLVECGLLEKDNSMGVIQHYGGGSSFSNAQDPNGMAITSRWKRIAEPQLLHILKLVLLDDELLDLLAEFYPDDADILRSLVG